MLVIYKKKFMEKPTPFVLARKCGLGGKPKKFGRWTIIKDPSSGMRVDGFHVGYHPKTHEEMLICQETYDDMLRSNHHRYQVDLRISKEQIVFSKLFTWLIPRSLRKTIKE